MSAIRLPLPVFTALTLGICAATASFAAPPAVTPGPSSPVQVTNTSTNPVPVTVQGSTTISGNVQVTNTPTVNVGNTPNVGIINNSASPVLVQQAGFLYSFDKVASCNQYNCTADFPVVPAGKMLVITYLNAIARPTLATTIFDFAELLTANTVDTRFGARNTFPMARIGTAGDSVVADTWGVNAPVLAFVIAGSYPRVTMTQRNKGDTFFAQVTIAGYLITASQ
jgi:hypothetical protein